MNGHENLIPFDKRTEEERREICSKGGKASQAVQKQKRTIQKILADFLDKNVESIPQLEKMAKKNGIKDVSNVKELFTLVCLLNSIKGGNLDALEKMCKLLGEETEYTDNNSDVMETLAKIKECAYNYDTDKPKTS